MYLSLGCQEMNFLAIVGPSGNIFITKINAKTGTRYPMLDRPNYTSLKPFLKLKDPQKVTVNTSKALFNKCNASWDTSYFF